MSKLNIAERRLPQDGRIPLRVQGKELDLRVSTVPTMFGESVVMRLLDKESVRFDLDALGFDGGPRARLDQIMEIPYGILLVTGPTGSGKSTTLYTVLTPAQYPGAQDHHGRGPGGIPDPRHQPDPGQARDRHDLRRALCAPSCARTRTSSWWVRCATWRRRGSPSSRP